jgi:subtilisin family serine protease
MVPLDSAQIELLIDSFIVQGDPILRRCMCNKMALVAHINTLTPQERRLEAEAKLEPQGEGGKKYGIAGLNYTLQFNPVTDSVQLNYEFGFQNIKHRAPSPNDKKAKVAIVDTEFNPSHSELLNNVWVNPNEQSDALDNDNNCIVNNFNGVDISTHQPEFSFTDGHGTAVAVKVMRALGGRYPSDVDIQLINVIFTYLDAVTSIQTADLFDTVCGMRYSISAGAPVMTASFISIGDMQLIALEIL